MALPPLERSAGVRHLYREAHLLAAEIHPDLGEGVTGGGSGGNLAAAPGVPIRDGLGAIGRGAHAAGECVEIASLPWRAALAGLLRRILER